MAVSFKTVTIETETYTIQQFTAGKSLRLLTRLAKLIGPALSSFALSGDLKGNQVEKLVGQSAQLLFANLDEGNVEETIRMILEGTLVNGQSVNSDFDTRFMGNLPLLFKLVQESLKVQYGGFSNVLALVGNQAKAMGTGSSALSTSSGPSGG